VKLCIIILNYFGSADTVACVKALLGQPLDRICIIDNSEGHKEIDALAAAFAGCPKVEIISSGQNRGFAGGVNFGLRRMLPLDFEAFIILNNDTVPPPDLTEKILRGVDAASLDVASPVIYRYPDQHILWSSGNYYNAWTGTLSTGRNPGILGSIFYLPGCCLFVQRRVFESAGLFDEAFFMYGEDVEFCHRAVQGGFRIGIVPDALIYHKTGASSVQNSFFYEYQINRGHLLLARKLFESKGAWLLCLFVKLPVLFLRACLRTVRFKNGNAIRGYAAALQGFFAK
jgi:GT2 family glycosyltransferase